MMSSRGPALLLIVAALMAVLSGAAQDSDERFRRLDRNGDGRLTPEELPEEWFARFDLNQDGVVTLEEAKTAVAGQRPTPVAAPPMAVHQDLVYAQVEGVDPKLLSLDLYVPDGATNAPVAVFVHGGSWQRGDKAQTEGTSLLASFITRGYLVAALNYRLAPAARFPAYPEDVAAGVAWVKQHVAEFGGDPRQIVLLGHSAGAHLVALIATDESYLRRHGLALTELRAVVPLDTEAYDLPHLAERFGGRLLDTWSIPFGQDPEIWRRASPVTHVAVGKGIAPMLIVYSGGMMDPQRRTNPSRAVDAEAFAEALRNAGGRAEVVGDRRKSHVQIISEFGLPDDTIAPAVFRFLDSVGRDPEPADEFEPDDTQMGSAETAYIDPEVLHTDGLVAFLDARLTAWVGRLDPLTGLFLTERGCDHRIDTGISKWSRYSNGPEWGLDRHGPALFYVKDDHAGRGQLWRAEPPWDKPVLSQLTRDDDDHNWLCEASLNPTLAAIRVAVYHGDPKAQGNADAWLDEDQPDKLHTFAQPMVVARWGTNTAFLAYAPKPRPGQVEPSQVALVDTDTGRSRVITGDAGHKIDPWLWQAPEFGGEALLCVNVDGAAVGLYRDTQHDGGPWERIATLKLPADAPHQRLKSVEPVNGGRGAFGRSYFTVQAGLDDDPETSIWLFGFAPDGGHLVRRLDDGAISGRAARRLDPESYVGERELCVYYSLVGDGPTQLRRCRTGICGQVADLNNDGLLDVVFAADPDNSGIATSGDRYQDKVYCNTGLHGARENHWLRVRFTGVGDAELIGSRIEARDAGTGKLLGLRVIAANDSYKSGCPLEVHFGLGKTAKVNVKAMLAAGRVVDITDVAVDRHLELALAAARAQAVPRVPR